MRIYINPGKSRNILATIAIGKTYLDDWEANAMPSWLDYCNRHDLGLVLFDVDLIAQEDPLWKKATWQKMLIGSLLSDKLPSVYNVCYLDTDILISPFAPNIFENYQSEKIGLISQLNNLPYPLHETLRRLAFMRHHYYDNKYPLDSALFMNIQQYYDFHDVEPQLDIACMGVFVFNVENHQKLMRSWFNKYDKNVDTLTGGGDEPLINFEMQAWGNIQWFPYKFQAIWNYEMSWKYHFLYDFGRYNKDLIQECIEASLYSNHFLHFAGSWFESDMWKLGPVFNGKKKINLARDFEEYLKQPVSGMPQGLIKPSKK